MAAAVLGGSLALAGMGIFPSVAAAAPTARTPAATAATSPANPAATSATSAATWLTQQLAAGSGLMPGMTAGVPDVGLTSDTLLSLIAAGQRSEPGFAASLAAVASHLTGYAIFPAGGTTALLAGPVAKTLFLAQVSGADPTSFGGENLPATVRSLLTRSGSDAGRFSDSGTGSDTSNGFSQAFAILGLSRDPGGVPASAVSYLLAQQCPSGAFRLFYDAPGGCRNDSAADPDATSVAVQALSALLAAGPDQPAISAARTSAARWLASRQQPDGGVGGAGPTAGENANSTALAAVAFRETALTAGLTSAASAAQRYVSGLQLSAGPDAGAVAYDPAALSAIGKAGAIPGTDADQWRRSTSQALLAFGLPGYDELPTVSGPPFPPGTPSPGQPSTPPNSPPASQPGSQPSPVTFPTGPGPAVRASGTPLPRNNFPNDSTDFGDQPITDTGNAADQNLADSTGPAAGDPGQTPSASPAHSGSTRNAVGSSESSTSTVAPLTHATPQAAVSPNSADGGVPGWVWITVAAGAGVGGGIVVLRLQAKRARS